MINYEWVIYLFFFIYNSLNIKLNYYLKTELHLAPAIFYLIANSIFVFSLYQHNLLILMGICLLNIVFSIIMICQYIYYNKFYTPILYHIIN